MPLSIVIVGLLAASGGLLCALIPRPISRAMRESLRPLLGQNTPEISSVRVVRVFGILVARVGVFFVLTAVI